MALGLRHQDFVTDSNTGGNLVRIIASPSERDTPGELHLTDSQQGDRDEMGKQNGLKNLNNLDDLISLHIGVNIKLLNGSIVIT